MPVNHDIGFFKNDAGWPDLKIENGDLKFDQGLQTAVLVSLFTDGLVSEDELPDGESVRRGWWADLVTDPVEDRIGSRIWLTDRAKVNQATVNRIIDLTRESLRWLIDEGVASRINVTAEINAVNPNRIDWRVEIFQPNEENFFFKFVWDGQEQIGFSNGIQ